MNENSMNESRTNEARPPAELNGRLTKDAGRTQRSHGIVLAIVLVLIFVLVTAVYAFQRKAIIDTSIAKNRILGAEADAIARGGLRMAEALVFLIRLKEQSNRAGLGPSTLGAQSAGRGAQPVPLDVLWSQMGNFPIDLGEDRSLRLTIEDEGSRLNLNALVPQSAETAGDSFAASDNRAELGSDEEAEEYLIDVLDYIIEGIDGAAENRNYDTRAIAENLLDYMDSDATARSGRGEDGYYQGQDPPYRARNGPFLSFDEIGLVEGVDQKLLNEMRHYFTVHPIGSQRGVNLNRAEPWVLSIVYSGISNDRELIKEQTVRDIMALRSKSKIICDDQSYDAARCVARSEIPGLSEGSIYPEAPLPSLVSVYRVVAEARVGDVTRKMEALIDTRATAGAQVLSWRRLRGPDS